MVDIASFARIRPMVNQVETHPFNQQTEAKAYMDKYGVQIEARAPFGEGRGGLFENGTLKEIGAQYGKTDVYKRQGQGSGRYLWHRRMENR